MAKFTIGKPITTGTPSVVVDAGLALGLHRFSLSVVDADGNTSKPDAVVVEVQRIRPIPTPVIRTPVRAKPSRNPS